MKLKIEHILIIGLFIYIILMQTCNSTPVIEKPVEVIRTDSIYVHTTDTITNTIKVAVSSVPLIESHIDLSDTSVFFDSVNSYHYGKQDSLLSYNIYIDSEIKPQDVRLEYELKNFTIYDSVNVYIRDSVYKEAPIKRRISIGGVLSGSIVSFGFAPMIDYQDRKGNTFKAGYDVIQQQYRIGYSKTLFDF